MPSLWSSIIAMKRFRHSSMLASEESRHILSFSSSPRVRRLVRHFRSTPPVVRKPVKIVAMPVSTALIVVGSKSHSLNFAAETIVAAEVRTTDPNSRMLRKLPPILQPQLLLR